MASKEKSLRILVIGDASVGKTSFIQTLSKKEPSLVEVNPEVSASNEKNEVHDDIFKQYPAFHFDVQEHSFQVTLVDGSEFCKFSAEKYKEYIESKNAVIELKVDGIFICYDISLRTSFENVDKKWKLLLEKWKVGENISIVLVGLKGDLNHSIDTSLIKMTKPYLDDDIVVSSKLFTIPNPFNSSNTVNNLIDSLSVMISTIMNTQNSNSKIKKANRSSQNLKNDLKTSTPSDSNTKSMTKSVSSPNFDSRRVGPSPHEFKIKYFPRPTWCDFCELFIWGVTSPQGYECTKCKYKSHKKCVQFVPHFCGLEK